MQSTTRERPVFFGMWVALVFLASTRLAAAMPTTTFPTPIAVGVFCAVLLSVSWPITRALIPATSFRRYATNAVLTGVVFGLLEHRDYWLSGALIVTAIGFHLFERRRSSQASLT